MNHLMIRWLHDFDDEPVLIYSEIDAEGYEIRKVEQYENGRLDVADAVTQTGSTVLAESPLPSLEAINAEVEFEGRAISQAEFDEIWRKAWEWFEFNGETSS